MNVAHCKASKLLHVMLRLYSSYESSNPGLRRSLLVPIWFHDEDSKIEKGLYRNSGRKVRLVVFYNNLNGFDAKRWQSKHDEVERLCTKVGVPFLSLRKQEKLRSYISLDDEYDGRSLCGIIVSFAVRSVWDDFENLHQEIARARMLKSFVQEQEFMNSNSKTAMDSIAKPALDSSSKPALDSSTKPALELPLKSQRRPINGEESSFGRSSFSPRTAARHDPKSKEGGHFQEADSRQPISELHVQQEESVFLRVGGASRVGAPLEPNGTLSVSDNGQPEDSRLLVKQTNGNSPERTEFSASLEEEVKEETTDFYRQLSEVTHPQMQTAKEDPVHRGQVGEIPVVTDCESSLDAGARLHSPFSDSRGTSSSGECNRALTCRITGLEVEALLFESNVESLSSLQLAIDLEIERSLDRLGNLSLRSASAESYLSSSRDQFELETSRFDLIQATLAENKERLASLLSVDLPLERLVRLREDVEASARSSEQPTFLGAVDDGSDLESCDMDATTRAVLPAYQVAVRGAAR
jgi:hypothetical protein